jgi:serine/alanine adding enzyme
LGRVATDAPGKEKTTWSFHSLNAIRIIHTSNEINEKDWRKFVFENKDGNIFQTPEMYRVFFDTEHYEPVFTALLDENGEIMATLLGALIEEPGRITRRFSRRIVVYGGPIISERGNRDYLLERILRAHDDYAKRRAIFTEIRNLAPRGELRPQFESAGYKYIDHLNILIDLSLGEESVWQGLQRSKKKGIRKAKRSVLIFSCLTASDLDEIFTLLEKTFRRLKHMLPPRSLFDAVFNILERKDLARIFGTRVGNRLVAIQVALTYKDVIYAWYSADIRTHPTVRANDFTVWSTMKWGINQGYKLFDFGGAGRSDKKYGVRDYKLQFGGKLVCYGQFIHIHHPLKYRFALIGFRIWRAFR